MTHPNREIPRPTCHGEEEPAVLASASDRREASPWRPSNMTDFDVFSGALCATCIIGVDQCELVALSMLDDDPVEQWAAAYENGALCQVACTGRQERSEAVRRAS